MSTPSPVAAVTTSLTGLWPDPLPSGQVGKPYSYTLTATGGVLPYTYTIVAGTLPPGLTLNAATGVISGTPTAIATLDAVTFSVTDSGVIMANPTKVSWIAPTTNTDGSAIAAGEITGYNVGIRPATGSAGTYNTLIPVSGAATLSVALPALTAGSYQVAVQVVGPNNSAWSPEAAFSIVVTPQAPSTPVVS